MNGTAGHRALRAGRASVPGCAYLLTTVTAYRRPLFKDHHLARSVCRCIHEAKHWGDASLLCWVLMPDHWHGLVTLGHRDSLSTVMNRFKAATAKQIRCIHPQVVWGTGFHDRALRREDDVRSVARYIVANPLRAGLVEAVLDYPYWNCVWL
ncbi:transposase [Dyella kyungheensis]|uniref:Transposase n=2 Tax=Dyella kyungheensis TaxID=1242174 RepID=A0ABS2JU02_9GAMM|nr:transposase [Dyella kyungheensis]MBM7122326.1 transposase [Dyella kyungheensis]